MAKYKASPQYTIQAGDEVITFDYFGNYETSDKDEIAVLDKNTPRYVTKVAEEKQEQKQQPKAEEKPKQAPAKRKPSAK